RRKVLVPLATLLAAGAVAIGSGATFTSTTASTTSVASGHVEHTLDNTTLDLTNIKPGDVITGSVKLTNTGTLPATVTLRESASTNTFTKDALTLELTQAGNATPLYSGNFGDLADTAVLPLGAVDVAGSTTVTWKVTFAADAGNVNEKKAATASYTWISTQNPGVALPFGATVGLPNLGD
ncbi:TasA family protein, partial [Nocardioides massiliensis]